MIEMNEALNLDPPQVRWIQALTYPVLRAMTMKCGDTLTLSCISFPFWSCFEQFPGQKGEIQRSVQLYQPIFAVTIHTCPRTGSLCDLFVVFCGLAAIRPWWRQHNGETLANRALDIVFVCLYRIPYVDLVVSFSNCSDKSSALNRARREKNILGVPHSGIVSLSGFRNKAPIVTLCKITYS